MFPRGGSLLNLSTCVFCGSGADIQTSPSGNPVGGSLGLSGARPPNAGCPLHVCVRAWSASPAISGARFQVRVGLHCLCHQFCS